MCEGTASKFRLINTIAVQTDIYSIVLLLNLPKFYRLHSKPGKLLLLIYNYLQVSDSVHVLNSRVLRKTRNMRLFIAISILYPLDTMSLQQTGFLNGPFQDPTCRLRYSDDIMPGRWWLLVMLTN